MMNKKMIFVTVGTGEFDELTKAMDKIAPEAGLRIVMQIGKGSYLPKNCEYIRFAPNLSEYYNRADLIIAHGGAGTTYELLAMGKKVISLANYDRTDTHQYEILKALSEEGYIIWCKSVKQIEECIEKAKEFNFRKYVPPKCTIAREIEKFLAKTD